MLVDHDRRRAELAEAVWRVVRRDGVRGASVRAVAAEAGLSTGSVRYFFTAQDELLRFAMRELVEKVRTRSAASITERLAAVAEGEPVDAVLAALCQVLPIDAERLAEAQVWFAFVVHESVDPVFREIRREMDEEVRELCGHCVMSLRETDALGVGRDPERETLVLWALLDGLTLRIYLDSLTPDVALDALGSHLHQLSTAPASTTRAL